jgi:NAD(P)H-hydrate repair Nnr-like enzyme with NAD(P)H-hydrate epimerase domain
VHKIVTTDEMRKIEQEADASGLTYDQMMQNAGKSIADATLEFLGGVEDKRVAILVGTGNINALLFLLAQGITEATALL